tara:strand:- start:1366 stop:1647 length:282 start_codon:yes stop_codon:yes gene_type:complete
MPLVQCICGNCWIQRTDIVAPDTPAENGLKCVDCGGFWKVNHEYMDLEEDGNWLDISYVKYHKKERVNGDRTCVVKVSRKWKVTDSSIKKSRY